MFRMIPKIDILLKQEGIKELACGEKSLYSIKECSLAGNAAGSDTLEIWCKNIR